MGTFKIVSRSELRARRKLNPEELALFDQFKSHLGKLDSREAGIYEFASGEDQDKCAKLLRKAARSIDVPVRIKRDEMALVFYRRGPRGRKKVA